MNEPNILASVSVEFQIHNGTGRYKIVLTERSTKTSKTLYRSAQCSFSIIQIRKPLMDMGIDINNPDLYFENGEIGYNSSSVWESCDIMDGWEGRYCDLPINPVAPNSVVTSHQIVIMTEAGVSIGVNGFIDDTQPVLAFADITQNVYNLLIDHVKSDISISDMNLETWITHNILLTRFSEPPIDRTPASPSYYDTWSFDKLLSEYCLRGFTPKSGENARSIIKCLEAHDKWYADNPQPTYHDYSYNELLQMVKERNIIHLGDETGDLRGRDYLIDILTKAETLEQ